MKKISDVRKTLWMVVLILTILASGCGGGSSSDSAATTTTTTTTDTTTTTTTGTPPTISSFTPLTGVESTSVTIFGADFSSTASDNTVKFNGTTAVVTAATSSWLVTTVPTGATTGPITVTTTGGTATSSADFTVTAPATYTTVLFTATTITVPTTCYTGYVYVVNSSVVITSTLTIQPGAIIKFKPGGYLQVNAGGSIIADGGSAATPIIFTSIKDDAHGGDTNGDGNATSPAAGDWEFIRLNTSGSVFNYCGFGYGGNKAIYYGTLTLYYVSATVTNCTFAHNGTVLGLTANSTLDAGTALAGTVITGNMFYDNTLPLRINTTFSLDDSNRFDNSGAQPNKYNGILVYGQDVLSAVTWSATKVPFVIRGAVVIGSGGSVTLAPNVVVKIQPNGYLQANAGGTINANAGSASTPITFTSIKDDAHGGDTNYDGSITTAAAGDWEFIRIMSNGSTFNQCRFYYGGNQSNYGTLTLSSVSSTVTNNIFAHNGTVDGLTANPALDAGTATAATVITGNTFYDNKLPIRINTTFGLDDSNTFNNGGLQPNKYNGILVWGQDLGSSLTWSATKVPFVVRGNLVIYSPLALTLGNNVVVKFQSAYGYLYLANGASLNQGTNTFLTSIKDDAHGGDTNEDGATSPASGDWYGMKNYNAYNTSPWCYVVTGMLYYTTTCSW